MLDVGCGTGFYLSAIIRLASAEGFGIDLSKDAASWCARRYPESAFAIADIWQRWPAHSRSVDLVLSLFAPKNYAEMARVLRPGGMVAMAFPGPLHFQELRESFGLLRLAGSKSDHYTARVEAHFSEISHQHISQRVAFDQQDIQDAILMGPNARHASANQLNNVPRRMHVTIDVELLFACKTVVGWRDATVFLHR